MSFTLIYNYITHPNNYVCIYTNVDISNLTYPPQISFETDLESQLVQNLGLQVLTNSTPTHSFDHHPTPPSTPPTLYLSGFSLFFFLLFKKKKE